MTSHMAAARVLTQTAPLIMTGLSVAFAFKTGLFNIGAAGQYTLGAFGALYFAIVLGMPWWVCLLVSAVFGALWGAIPGIFKAYLNINEVITSIMFNWIGLYLVNGESMARAPRDLVMRIPAAQAGHQRPAGADPFLRDERTVPQQQHHHRHLSGHYRGHCGVGRAGKNDLWL